MKITNVMNDQAKGKRPAVSVTREVLCDLLVVVRWFVGSSVVADPVSKVLESSDNIIGGLLEGIIRKITTLVKVRLVDEVPSTLETVGALDVIGKSSTLCEGMGTLALRQGSVCACQSTKFLQSGCESSGIFFFKNGLGVPCN